MYPAVKSKTSVKAIAGVFCLLIACLSAVLFMFNGLVASYKKSVSAESATHLAEVTRQVRMYIEETMRSDRSLTRSLAQIIKTYSPSDTSGLLNLLGTYKQLWDVKHIYIYNSKGLCVDENGTQRFNGMSINDIYEAVNRGESLWLNDTQMEFSTAAKSNIFLHGSPIVAVSIVRDLSTMLDKMGFNSFGGAGYLYLTHQNGIKISQTSKNDAPQVYNAAALFQPEHLINLSNPGISLKSAMGRSKEEVFSYNDNSVPRYVVLTPVNAPGERWFIFYVIRENIVDGSIDSFSRHVGLLTLFVAFLMLLLFIIFALIYTYKSRKHTEELKMRDKFVDLLMSETDNVFFLVSAQEQKPLYISSNASSVFGEKRLNICGHENTFRFCVPQGKEESVAINRLNAELDKWHGNSAFVSDYVPCNIKGKSSYLVLRLYPVEGHKDEYLGLVQNVTWERQREDALTKALTMADSANKAKTRFLSNMSHDIRTPLNAIVSLARFAEKDADNKERLLKQIHVIQHSSEHLQQLINDVLDMSRIESGNLTLAEDCFNLNDTIDAIREIIDPLCSAKKQKLIFDYSGVKTVHIKGDNLKLRQILINLLNNSAKFTDDNGTVSFETTELPSLNPNIASYSFTVKDNGIGIPEDKIKTIFEPFARVDESKVHKIEGTGLGLAITKRFVEAMGGSITVESSVGRGSTFKIEMSFAVDNNYKNDEPKNAAVSDVIRFDGKHVLLAEDNEINRYIAKTILGGWGLAVDDVPDGKGAVERFEASAKGFYSIIFMDIQMPVMDGYEAAVAIRHLQRPDAATVPIVAMTANVFAEDVERARQSGMNAHVGKPIDPDMLRKVVVDSLSENAD